MKRTPTKETPIERIFRKVFHRNMTAAEKRVFLRKLTNKRKAA